MNDNLSIFITVIVLVILLVIFPLYNHFERQDNMSYNLVLKSTTNFIDSVINCGYIDQQMYSNYVGEIANTGNLYDIELEAHKKIITADTQGIGEFQDQYLVDYNEDIFDESGTTNNNKNYDNLNEKSIKNGVYKLDVGDEIYIKVKNSGTTMAEALFRNIVPTATAKNITVNYGGIIKNNAWLRADSSVIAKQLIELTYKYDGNEVKEQQYLYHGEKNVVFNLQYDKLITDPNFKGWIREENVGTYEPEYKKGVNKTIELTKSVVLVPIIETPKPMVKFKAYSTDDPTSRTVTFGKAYGNLPEPESKEGYDFAGWFTQKEGGEQIKATDVVSTKSNHELHAHWTPKDVLVKFDINNGSSAIITSKTVKYDSIYGELPAPTRECYTFMGWYNDSNYEVEESTKVKNEQEHTLKAKWTPKLKVTLSANGGSYAPNICIYVDKGGKYEGLDDMSKPTRNNCTFAGWFTSSEGGSKVTSSSDIKSNTNHTLYAHWTPNANYRITKINTSSYSVYKLSASGYLDAISTKVVSNKVYKVKSTNKQASGSGAGLQFWYIEAEDIYINKDAFQ